MKLLALIPLPMLFCLCLFGSWTVGDWVSDLKPRSPLFIALGTGTALTLGLSTVAGMFVWIVWATT